MDENLRKLISGEDPGDAGGHETSVTIRNPDTGEIEVETGGGSVTYHLKPLEELFGKGRSPSVITSDETYMPLLMAIESAIAEYFRSHPELTDGQVLLSVGKMSMNPAADCGPDALCRTIQLNLRMILSLNEYSKQETKQAVRKVMASVERHTRSGGLRGYLEFIQEYA